MDHTFTFSELPTSVEHLRKLPEFAMTTPFMTAALTVAVLCNYEQDPEETYRMLDELRGPKPLSVYEKQFLRDRLVGKGYKSYSFFHGAVPTNNYKPDEPFEITVYDDPYSYQNAGYARLQLRSGGADNLRPITLRSKGNQWFLWEQMLLSDIRTPAKNDPWA
ncbi:MAG: hypothetical protein IKS05_09745 [Oscillospiraceae bacterium]|nr:hypothetical protein [Oscillospiraceae bacterium]